jgi:hypothetical protein
MMFLLCLYLSSILALESSRPVMYWTNSQGESQHLFDDSTQKIKNIMMRTDPSKEKLTFAFLFNGLDFQTMSNLKGKITEDNSKDSLFMPFVTGNFKLASQHVGTRAHSWSHFLDNQDASTNVVVFEPKDDEEFNQLYQKSEAYAKNSEKQVGFIVTSQKSRELPEPKSSFRNAMFSELIAGEATDTVYTGPQSITPFTFQALLIVMLVFFGTCIGNTCLSEIQVPITYLHKELPIRKEY